jgi:hypothetical protein
MLGGDEHHLAVTQLPAHLFPGKTGGGDFFEVFSPLRMLAFGHGPPMRWETLAPVVKAGSDAEA